LSDDQGFAEIVNEPEVLDPRGVASTSIVVYFLQPDGTTPMTPPPEEVKVEVNTGQSRAVSLPLNPEPKASDPAGASRFVSKMGPYILENLRGTLKARNGSRSIEVVFSGGR
jgi:hypothetical protein